MEPIIGEELLKLRFVNWGNCWIFFVDLSEYIFDFEKNLFFCFF